MFASALLIIRFSLGNILRMAIGTGMLDLVVLPDWKNVLLHCMRRFKSSSSRLNRFPPTKDHKTFNTEIENSPLKSITPSGSEWAVSNISFISSLISSLI